MKYVHINVIHSNCKIIKYGVPQGNVLGPVQFNISLDTMFLQNTKVEIVSCVYDTAIFYKNDYLMDLKSDIEHGFKKIINFLENGYFYFNYCL